jgi:hypothetical protein
MTHKNTVAYVFGFVIFLLVMIVSYYKILESTKEQIKTNIHVKIDNEYIRLNKEVLSHRLNQLKISLEKNANENVISSIQRRHIYKLVPVLKDAHSALADFISRNGDIPLDVLNSAQLQLAEKELLRRNIMSQNFIKSTRETFDHLSEYEFNYNNSVILLGIIIDIEILQYLLKTKSKFSGTLDLTKAQSAINLIKKFKSETKSELYKSPYTDPEKYNYDEIYERVDNLLNIEPNYNHNRIETFASSFDSSFAGSFDNAFDNTLTCPDGYSPINSYMMEVSKSENESELLERYGVPNKRKVQSNNIGFNSAVHSTNMELTKSIEDANEYCNDNSNLVRGTGVYGNYEKNKVSNGTHCNKRGKDFISDETAFGTEISAFTNNKYSKHSAEQAELLRVNISEARELNKQLRSVRVDESGRSSLRNDYDYLN